MNSIRRFLPELTAPAGDWASARSVVAAGADSVYFGIRGLNMRHQAANFDCADMFRLMRFLHQHGKKGYLALNVIVFDRELARVKTILRAARKAGVDAVIAWDMAVVRLAGEIGLPVHLSTQASVSNSEAVFWYAGIGVRRIVLARECTLIDIARIAREIKKRGLPCELETFVHGAMCVSISGRCFLSQESFGESANRGRCIQPCRRNYIIKDVDQGHEYELGRDFVLSPKDVCALPFIEQLIKAGARAFKIEGRRRSPEYAGVVTGAYRAALDAWQAGSLTAALKEQLMDTLRSVYTRGFSEGFYHGAPRQWIAPGLAHTHQKEYSGIVTRMYPKAGVAEVAVQGAPIKKNNVLLFIGPISGSQFCRADSLQQNNQDIAVAERAARVGIKIPFRVRIGDKVYLWKRRGNSIK